MALIDMTGKTIIITGAGSGIGRATARMLAEQGASVIVADIADGPANETVQLITEAGGIARAFVGDVGDEEQCAALVEDAMKDGHLDGLVNNAGIMDYFAGVGESTTELYRKVFRVNVDGPFFLSRAAMPHLLESKGSIVNTSSAAGIRGAAAGAIYTMSKHAVVGLTRNTAYTYGRRGVRCNAVCPGGVATNIGASMPQDRLNMEGLGAITPIHQGALRTGDSEELAAMIVFLLSDEASFVNGLIAPVDGGWAAG
ncbi:MAG TPA: SDR family oxidoreductase [Actinomycetaceae bacterium]|nr:SDR family oxidoreductase [Actinomycetaceae bacterium]